MLEGSGDGILYYITPDFTKMQEMQVNLKPLCSGCTIKSELNHQNLLSCQPKVTVKKYFVYNCSVKHSRVHFN